MGTSYGLAFPLVFSNGNYVDPTLEESIESSVKNILAYDSNSRPFMADFFGDLYLHLSAPNDSISQSRIRLIITEAIKRYEPRVSVKNILLKTLDDGIIVEIHTTINEIQKELIITLNG
jgi:phage baseplate assembly protein W